MKLPINLLVTILISGLQMFAVGDLISSPKAIRWMLAISAFLRLTTTTIAQYSTPPGSVSIKVPTWISNLLGVFVLLVFAMPLLGQTGPAPSSPAPMTVFAAAGASYGPKAAGLATFGYGTKEVYSYTTEQFSGGVFSLRTGVMTCRTLNESVRACQVVDIGAATPTGGGMSLAASGRGVGIVKIPKTEKYYLAIDVGVIKNGAKTGFSGALLIGRTF